MLSAQDGPLYHPGVCILSIAAPAVMRFTRKRSSTDNESPGATLSHVYDIVLLQRGLVCGVPRACDIESMSMQGKNDIVASR